MLGFVRFDARFQRLFPCIPLLVHLVGNFLEAFLKSILHFGHDVRDGCFFQSENAPSDSDRDRQNRLETSAAHLPFHPSVPQVLPG